MTSTILELKTNKLITKCKISVRLRNKGVALTEGSLLMRIRSRTIRSNRKSPPTLCHLSRSLHFPEVCLLPCAHPCLPLLPKFTFTFVISFFNILLFQIIPMIHCSCVQAPRVVLSVPCVYERRPQTHTLTPLYYFLCEDVPRLKALPSSLPPNS